MNKFSIDTEEFGRLMLLTGFFVFLGLLLYFVHLGQYAWTILAISAFGWFLLESVGNQSRVRNAMKVGLFLLIFDFICENTGWLLGLWHTVSIFALGVVPIEVMAVCFFGGTAWALYLPKKFNLWHSAMDCLVFALFGALGEWLLIRQGLFYYTLWWTSAFAFAAYLITWIILHYVRYRVIKV